MTADRDPRQREQEPSPAQEQRPPEVAGAAPGGLAGHVLGLQSSAGNQAVARLVRERGRPQIARTPSMPLGGGVPAGAKATDFAEFLRIIRIEEGKLPLAEQTNTKLMVTRLRKLFYGGEGWDKYLIPGAAGVAPIYKFEEKETKREEVEIEGAPNIDHVTKEASVPGAPTELQKPGTFQEVKMPNGDFVDVGHVLAGLDAFNNPSAAAGPLGTFSVKSNAAAVTWLGDIASIAGEIIIKTVKAGKKTYTEAELQAEVTSLAPSQDMLGNVDAYVINDTFAVGGSAGMKVSDILEQYYGGPGAASSAGKAARDQRFTKFASLLGLGALAGGTFANEATWKAAMLPELRNTTALYTASATASTTSVIGAPSRLGFAQGAADNVVNVTLLNVFVDELRARVAAEAAAAPAPAGL